MGGAVVGGQVTESAKPPTRKEADRDLIGHGHFEGYTLTPSTFGFGQETLQQESADAMASSL